MDDETNWGFTGTSLQRSYYRCGGDDCPASTPSPLKCKADVYFKCNKCDASVQQWKLKAPEAATNADSVKGLFELRTNPGEETSLDCSKLATPQLEITQIRNALWPLLSDWRTNVDNGANAPQ